MTGAQRELKRRMRAIVQWLRVTPRVRRMHLASLDRRVAALRLVERAVLELKADPEMLEPMRAGENKTGK